MMAFNRKLGALAAARAAAQAAPSRTAAPSRMATHQIKAPAMSPAQTALSDKLNYGFGAGQSFFSTTPMMGSALSPVASAVRKADSTMRTIGPPMARLAGRYAEGGKVEVAVSALRKLKAALNRQQSEDRSRALDTLRSSRDALLQMAEGGMVPPEQQAGAAAPQADPQMLVLEYQQLLAQLQSAEIDEAAQMQILQRLQQLEEALTALGVDVGAAQQAEGTGQMMMPQAMPPG